MISHTDERCALLLGSGPGGAPVAGQASNILKCELASNNHLGDGESD